VIVTLTVQFDLAESEDFRIHGASCSSGRTDSLDPVLRWYSNKTRGRQAQRLAPATAGPGIPVHSPPGARFVLGNGSSVASGMQFVGCRVFGPPADSALDLEKREKRTGPRDYAIVPEPGVPGQEGSRYTFRSIHNRNRSGRIDP